ncbi:protein of unknown function (plasmid) [Cupriavidus neocaledonicus]|uniref:Uncharacterized protein n=1 Tax=Cupriavidus neocaledonicus TaxID=1040979 RepID=A0A375HMX2_9BURK|nr:hypothetical protein CBM2605_B130405 [Cupriavidus neocaledonicus]SPD59222.1 protein of unknown function [Cupriavidus neocaledonicus]
MMLCTKAAYGSYTMGFPCFQTFGHERKNPYPCARRGRTRARRGRRPARQADRPGL